MLLKLSSFKVLCTKKFIFWLLFWTLVIIPGAPFILGNLAYVIYIYWPRDISTVAEFSVDDSVNYVSISAHGVKDNPSSWSDALQQAISERNEHNESKQKNISLDWSLFSGNPFICSVAGKRIGRRIGEQIAEGKNVRYIHAIGHSCGAFVVVGICEGVKQSGRDIKVHTTYLDPVSIYAGYFWDYGINNFGPCADFSDAYIDTQDGVPGSNEQLPHTHTFDVTQARIARGVDDTPHNWPTRYYLEAFIDGGVPLFSEGGTELTALYPKGKLSKVNN